MADDLIPAHAQTVTNRYVIHYPDHEPREGDPHYADFRAWKKRQRATPGAWRCAWAARVDDDSQCAPGPLEAHHGHIEFAMARAVDLTHLEHLYPGISNPDEVGAWIESDQNLILYCPRHHRSADAGLHHLSAADFEASHFLAVGTITTADAPKPHRGTDINPKGPAA